MVTGPQILAAIGALALLGTTTQGELGAAITSAFLIVIAGAWAFYRGHRTPERDSDSNSIAADADEA